MSRATSPVPRKLARGRARRWLVLAVLLSLLLPSAGALAEDEPGTWLPAPLRLRNLTYPTVLVMGFKPAPVITLPPGTWAAELDVAVSNCFQMSSGIESVLAGRRGPRRPLDEADVQAIRDQTVGDQFLIDGEMTVVDLGLHYGLTETIDLSLYLAHLSYGGGILDPLIWDFHDAFGFSQAGRELVADDHFQVVYLDRDGEVVQLDRPTSGGLADPMVTVRWAGPIRTGRWQWGIEAGIKVPLADKERWLSTGSLDAGVQITAQRKWERDAVIANLALVVPGRFEVGMPFEPPDLPALDVAWVHRTGARTSAILQLLASESILRTVTHSDLSKIELQLTAGMAWQVGGGRIALAVTENIFNFDNTPDLGVHMSFGKVFGSPATLLSGSPAAATATFPANAPSGCHF